MSVVLRSVKGPAMHGIIFSELRKYVEAKTGDKGWDMLMTKAGLSTKLYTPFGNYADAEVVALVTAASEATGRPVQAILEDFGEFIVPSLVGMYAHLLDRSWTALDVIEHTENRVHAVVRTQNKGATPPKLKVERISKGEVLLTYDSPRKMCAVAKGIARGVGKHFKENLVITESQCMHRGAPNCKIYFRSPLV